MLDEGLLRRSRELSGRWVAAQREAGLAKADYQHAVRRLHFAGGSLREIAEALGISHQRVHQIVAASGGTSGWKPRKKAAVEIACTFCGLPKAEVIKLIAGPGVYVCDDCVALAHQVVREVVPVETERTRLDPVPHASRLGCSFCGKAAGQVNALVAGPGVRICNPCLGLCDEIIAAHPG
jgi:hypothetical protein